MIETYYTGVDGGMSGAIAIVTNPPGLFDVFALLDIPMQKTAGFKKPWYNAPAVHRIFRSKRMIVGLEESYRFPKLCKGIGILWACACLSPSVTSVIMVRPQQWQKWAGIKKADKNLSLEIARKLFPGQKRMLMRKGDHNRAEALLIASYIRSVYSGRPVYKK